jgi:hypothetical protein
MSDNNESEIGNNESENNEIEMMRNADLEFAKEDIEATLEMMGGKNTLNANIIRDIYTAKAEEWGEKDAKLKEMILASMANHNNHNNHYNRAVPMNNLQRIIANLPPTAGAGNAVTLYKKYQKAAKNHPEYADELNAAGRAAAKELAVNWNANYRNAALKGVFGNTAKYQAEQNLLEEKLRRQKNRATRNNKARKNRKSRKLRR